MFNLKEDFKKKSLMKDILYNNDFNNFKVEMWFKESLKNCFNKEEIFCIKTFNDPLDNKFKSNYFSLPPS